MPWFLSGEPDVLALLDEQVEATVTGMRAYAAWMRSASDDDALAVRDAEHAADDARRRVVEGLRRCPRDAPRARGPLHDVRTDRRRHQRREELGARRRGTRVDTGRGPAGMADLLVEGTEHLAHAVRCIRHDPTEAGKRADDATHCCRLVEKAYRAAIVSLRDSSMQTHSRSSRRSRRTETSWRSQTRSCTWRTGSGTRC